MLFIIDSSCFQLLCECKELVGIQAKFLPLLRLGLFCVARTFRTIVLVVTRICLVGLGDC